MFPTKQNITLALLATSIALFTLSGGQKGTNIKILSTKCQDQLEAIWKSYAVEALNSTETNSEAQDCKTILEDAIYSEKSQNCPTQSDIQGCLTLQADAWKEYASTCELFLYGEAAASSGGGGEGEGEGEGEGRRRSLLAGEGGEGEGGEGGGGGSSLAGCFPAFDDLEEFDEYVDGYIKGDGYNEAGGIVVSVLFWVLMAAVGFLTKG